jgi:hypothetical protein
MIKTYANQKIIIVTKIEGNKYSIFNIEGLDKALKELSGNAFKLYAYMNRNQNNYKFALSCSDVMQKLMISNKTYYSCVDELISKGYLVSNKEDSNIYNFMENTVCNNYTVSKEENIGLCNNYTGNCVENTHNRVKTTQDRVKSTEEIIHNNTYNTLYNTNNNINNISSVEITQLDLLNKSSAYKKIIQLDLGGKDIYVEYIEDGQRNYEWYTVFPEFRQECGSYEIGSIIKVISVNEDTDNNRWYRRIEEYEVIQ